MSSRDARIGCRSLSKRFGAVHAVEQLTFDVEAGSITGFVGANGAGKTTTMRMILGLVEPSGGAALVNGVPYRELIDPRRQVGAALDGAGAHPGHTARTHLAIAATAAGLPRRRVDEVLELVELADHAGRRVGAFSMGMYQRLALAGALLGDPGILILDEPANGLDPAGILWLRALLRGLADEGRVVLISSHLLAELAEVADRVVIIDRGRLVADATLPELLAGRSRAVELGCANPPPVVAALRARGLRVTEEDGFLVIEGASAREVGAIADTVAAGPVHHLRERVSSFEDAYFELAGSLAQPARTREQSAS